MELQIQDLVSSIRKEGVDTAKAQADAILAEAKKAAAEIISKAQAEAKTITDNAGRDVAALKENARLNAEQARRDAALSFKGEIQKEYAKLLAADVKKTVKGEALAKLIAAALKGENPADYVAEVNEVTTGLKGELAAELKAGLEIRPSRQVNAGFKLVMKNGSGYFDCTEEELTAVLMPFFSDLTV